MEGLPFVLISSSAQVHAIVYLIVLLQTIVYHVAEHHNTVH